MTDLYAQQYESAGPIARPVIQRSQYLADALRALQNTSENPIRSRSQLGVNLLAQALMQYQQNRNQSQLQNATEKDSAALNAPLLAQLDLLTGSGAPPAQAPAAPEPQAATPPPVSPQSQPIAAMGAGSGVGTGGPSNRDIKTRDAVIRLLALEDNHPQGQQAVGNVILNRARTGMDLADVITQPSQFEPYGNRQTWERGMQIPATDPRYQQAERAWEAAQQQDITGGALNFYGPRTQAALGRQPPDFARGGGGQMIGGNEFFAGQFAPPRGYQMPPPAPPGSETTSTNGYPVPPPPAPPQEAPGPPPAAGAPPAALPSAAPPPPAAGGQPPGINGMAAIPQQELQYIRGLMGNPDPRMQAQGRTMLQAALGRAMQVPGYHTTADNDRGYIIYTPDNPAVGQPFTRPIPGWQPNTDMTTINGAPASYQHGNAAAGVTPVPVPQQLMSHPAQGPAEMAGITPGAGVDVDPLGNRRMVDRPPEGYNRTPGGLQAAPGGQHDITAPAQRVPALIAQRDRLRPTLEQANMVFQNINAVRRGVEAQSGPGDLAIANGFQQLLNSGMVTGEEINAQARSLGLQGQVGSIIQYVRGGGNLTPEARAQFGRLAEQLYVPRLRQIQQQVMSQRDLLDQYGPGSFDLVVPPSLRQELGWEARPQQRHGAAQGQPSARRPRLVGSF